MRAGSAWEFASVDSPRYLQLANGLPAGCGFARLVGRHCGAPEVFRTPGYPLFLALIPSLRMVVVVQALLGAALCVLLGLAVSRYWGFRAGVIAELLLVLDVPTIVEGSQIMSDVLFQVLLAVALLIQLWCIARNRCDRRCIAAALSAAALLAVALLVRPVGILLPLIAPLPFALMLPAAGWRKTILLGLAAFALPALVMGGWIARNDARTGVPTLSTNVAINLYYYNAGGVLRYRSGETFQVVMDRLARNIGLPDARDYPNTPAAFAPLMAARGTRILLHDPLATFIVTARTIAWLMLVPDRGSLNDLLGTNAGATSYLAATAQLRERFTQMWRSPLLTALVAMQFALILAMWIGVGFALYACVDKSPRDASLVLIPFAVGMAMMVLAAGAEAYARYRMPALPLLALVAGVGWANVLALHALRVAAARSVPV